MNEQFINWIKRNKSSIKTQNNYIYEVGRFFTVFDTFTQQTFNDYMDSLANNVSSSTYNRIGYALKSYVDFLKENGVNLENFKCIKPKVVKSRIRPYLTEEEFKQGLTYFEDIFKNHTIQKLRCEIMFYTGLRAYEMAHITRNNIDLQKGEIYVNVTKGKKPRIVYIPKHLIGRVKAYFNNYREIGSAFNCSEATLTYICKTYNNMVSPNKKWYVHGFRHAFAHYAYTLTRDIRDVSNLLGHSDLATTQIYLQTSNEESLENYKKAVDRKYRKEL